MKYINGIALSYQEYREYILGKPKEQKKKKVKEPKKVKRVKYSVYIKSKEWKQKRDHIMELFNYTCFDCTGKATQVHHLTYDNLGNEKDEDLIPLCSICHQGRHELLAHQKGKQ